MSDNQTAPTEQNETEQSETTVQIQPTPEETHEAFDWDASGKKGDDPPS